MTRLRSLLGLMIVALAAMAAPAAAEPLGRWSLDEGSGQVAHDSTGNRHDGRLGSSSGPDGNDPSWVPGRFGTALRFQGDQNQFVTVDDPGNLQPRELTVSAWVRRLGTPGRWRYVFSNGAVACEFASFGLYSGFDGGLAFYVSDADHFVRSPEAPQEAVWDGAWHRAVGTYDGHRVRLFLDGVEVGSGTATTLMIAYGFPMAFIGTYRGSCERPFTGDIDELAIDSVARGAEQIADDAARDLAIPLPPQLPPVSGPPAAAPPPAKVVRPARCLSIYAKPKRVLVGRRTRLVVSVRRSGRPVVRKRVSVRGLGVKRTLKTGRRGRARLHVRLKRPGRLRLAAKGEPARCAKRVRVKRKRGARKHALRKSAARKVALRESGAKRSR